MERVPFLDANQFPWTKTFQEHFPEVRAEVYGQLEKMSALYPGYVETAAGNKGVSTQWLGKTIEFFTIKNRPVLAQMPTTARLLQQVPGFVSAVILKMEGNTHLKPHGGFSPDVLRCHLGISVPEPDACILRVEQERRNWKEGEWLIFDDYLEHEVWHNGKLTRVVLLIDIVYPGVTYTPKQVCERFFNKVPGIRYEDDLDALAEPETWLEWAAAGEFPF
jgi:beta-hydroxylase